MVWVWSLQALPSDTFSDIYNSCSAQSWSSPLCFPARSSPLLPSKAEIICEQFFATVSNVVRNNNVNDPNGILVDFETAINAIRNVLPQTDISGGFFHLSLNLWKHIQRAGSQECYMSDPEFGLQFRLIAALAFVPPQDVANSFDQLFVVIRNQYDGDADKVLSYFVDTNIGHFRRNAPRRPPLFPIELWNMFHRTA